MNEDGTQLKQLTTMGESYHGEFSADGKIIFFVHKGDVWKMNADGSGQANLTETPDEREVSLAVAPDGTRIAYDVSGVFRVFTMKVDGTDKKRITDTAALWFAWSPDSKKIAFTALTSIWVVNRNGSDPVQVADTSSLMHFFFSVIFSRDGGQIAYSTVTSEGCEIWVINTDGSSAHQAHKAFTPETTANCQLVAWKKGKFLVDGSWEGNDKPYLVPEAGGPAVRLLSGASNDEPTDWWVP